MRAFQLGHSSGGDADHLVDDCLEQLGPVNSYANLGFVYTTDILSAELGHILNRLREATGVEHWTGTTGMGICTTATEYYEQPALVVMLAKFPDDSFLNIPNQRTGIEAFTGAQNTWYRQHASHFGVLHGDPTNPVTPQLINRLAAVVPGAFFVGGLTSSNDINVQIADQPTTGGVSGVLFSDDVPVVTGHTQGCVPIAGKHVITSCERNTIFEIDGHPALDVFNDDIGEVLAKDLTRVAGYIFAGLPIQGSDTNDYMVRNLVGIDPRKKYVAIGDMLNEGQEIMFCRRDGNSAREDMLRMLHNIKNRMGHTPRGGLYYSCLGRGRYQFGENSEELKFIRDELGDFPLAGFFANGEIFHNRLYGYTGVLTLFS